MAARNDGNSVTFGAGADLSSAQYHIVKLDSSGDVVLAAAGTDALIGTLNNAPVEDDQADVYLRSASGIGLVEAGGTISAGAAITSNASGEAVSTTTDGDHVLGFALEDAVDGDIFRFMPSTARLFIA